MNNYFTDTIIRVDIILLITALTLSALIIFYTILKKSFLHKRNTALLNIKKNVYELVMSGAKTSKAVCLPFADGATPRQFIDVETNRDTVFFNKSEQEAFKTARHSRNKWRKIEAILSLGYLNSPNSIKILKKTSLSKNDDIQYFSILSLGQIKSGHAASVLVDLIKNNIFSGHKLISILETFPPEILSAYIDNLLSDKKTDVRLCGLRLLSRLKDPRYTAHASKLMKDPSSEVRVAACECLGFSKNKNAADELYSAMKRDTWSVRAAAVKALSELLGKECLPKVMELVTDSSLSVLAAVKTVMITNIDAATAYIEKILIGDDKMAKRIAIEALEEAGRKEAK
jgi:HEAT repeat protein